MTREEKQLLFKVLCAMLPYGVIVQDRNGTHVLTLGNTELGTEYIKPYLRPMSSMTEEESSEMSNIISEWHNKELFYLTEEPAIELALPIINYTISPRLFDWLYAHYLDPFGLIPMGLALEAPAGMYKIE